MYLNQPEIVEDSGYVKPHFEKIMGFSPNMIRPWEYLKPILRYICLSITFPYFFTTSLISSALPIKVQTADYLSENIY